MRTTKVVIPTKANVHEKQNSNFVQTCDLKSSTRNIG